MPRLAVWMVRVSLLCFGIGFTFGGLMLYNKGEPFDPSVWRLLPAHMELTLIGWMVQLAMGVAFWILPRFRHEPRYGKQRLGWLAFALLNIGVLSAGAGQWLSAPPIIVWLARVVELLAVICFALHAWPRVKPVEA